MAAVRWEDFEDNPAGFEKLAKLLLLREFPGAVSIDGRGGDSGIDVRWDSPAGLVVFECKKYTKITNAQRRHIRRSLDQAAQHNPIRWVLVAPTDPTPALHSWFFTQLAAEVPFSLDWFHRSWLDERIAAHPDIRRYALDGPGTEVYNAIKEARAESDCLVRIPDFVTRASALQARADEMSPFWSITWDATTNQINATAKPGVTEADLGVDFALHFPDDNEHAQATRILYEEARAVGGTVTIPPQYVTNVSIASLRDLGWPDGPSEMTFIAAQHNDDLPLPITLRVIGGSGPPTPPIHVSLIRRELGTQGVTLHGTDTTGLLALRLIVRRTPDGPVRIDLNLNLKDGTEPGISVPACDPSAVLRLYEFLAGIGVDRIMQIGLPKEQLSSPIAVAADPEFPRLRDLLRDLVHVRDTLGLNLPIPDVWTVPDQRVIRFAAQLLRDGEARLPWRTRPTSSHSAEQFLHLSGTTSLQNAILRLQMPQLVLTFNGQSFDLGQTWYHFDCVDLEDPEGRVETARAGGDVDCVFVPRPGTRRIASRTPFPDTPNIPASTSAARDSRDATR
ncbi:hypothetical protein [Lentzea sp. NPDC003310]|uniref:restriction endonuclease n=1 Tax=Lentzea sp. NPDC003310 TaxID=3154447 RepID=UPI0033A2ADA3